MRISKFNAEGYYDPTAYNALKAIEKETNKRKKAKKTEEKEGHKVERK